MVVIISFFAKQLKPTGIIKDTLGFVYSDFPLGVGENKSGVTDHGHTGFIVVCYWRFVSTQGISKLARAIVWLERGEVFLNYGVNFRVLNHQVRKFI